MSCPRIAESRICGRNLQDRNWRPPMQHPPPEQTERISPMGNQALRVVPPRVSKRRKNRARREPQPERCQLPAMPLRTERGEDIAGAAVDVADAAMAVVIPEVVTDASVQNSVPPALPSKALLRRRPLSPAFRN